MVWENEVRMKEIKEGGREEKKKDMRDRRGEGESGERWGEKEEGKIK